MAMLNEKVIGQLRQVFEGLGGPVKLVVFTQGEGADETIAIECQTCHETCQLIEEIAAVDERITMEKYDLVKDEAIAQQYKVDKIPAVAVLGGAEHKDWGIRFFGIPSGYEFGSLIETIVLASKGEPGLYPKTMRALEKLNKPAHIQVYVTPT